MKHFPFTVVCIDNNGQEKYLTQGKMYTVIAERNFDGVEYWMSKVENNNLHNMTFAKTRFNDVVAADVIMGILDMLGEENDEDGEVFP